MSDGNENLGDAMAAGTWRRGPLGVTVDVIPLGVERGNDVSVQKLGLPSRVKKGADIRNADFHQRGQSRNRQRCGLYRNDQPLGEQKVELTAGEEPVHVSADAERQRVLQLQRVRRYRRRTACRKTTRHRASRMCAAIQGY
jgi:hypothetical protein